jgi:hypothetical protein
VACGIAAATLGLSVAACDDDSGGADLGPDTGVPADLKPLADMTASNQDGPPADMTAGPGRGQVVVADIVGTVYKDNGDAGVQSLPLTHQLIGVASFPKVDATSDFSNLALDVATLKLSGCVANRYDATAGRLPQADQDVGTVTLGGFNTKRLAAGGPVAQNGLFAPPIPATATCVNPSGGLPYYACFFAGTAGGATAAGSPTNGTAFPALDLTTWTTACAGLGGGCLPADCDQTGHAGVCEQHLWTPGVTANTATVAVVGGNGYGAANSSIGGGTPASNILPDNVAITQIKIGTTVITPAVAGKPSMADIEGHIDPTQDLSISWSCDGNPASPAGTGCSGLSAFDLVSISGVTSLNARTSFSTPQSLKFGTATCFEQAKKSDATITLPAAGVAAFLGAINGNPKQSTGSANLILLRVKGALGTGAGQLQLHSAGHGQFGLINLVP